MTRIIHMLCEATNGYVFWKRGNNDCEFWEELLTPHVRSTSMFSIFDTFSSGGLDFNVILAGSGQWKKLRKICDTILKTATNTLLFMFSFYISFFKFFFKKPIWSKFQHVSNPWNFLESIFVVCAFLNHSHYLF